MMEATPRWPTKTFVDFPSFTSCDAEEVQKKVSNLFCEHDLRVVGKSQSLDTRLSFRHGRDLNYGSLLYGATVDISPGKLNNFYLLQIPVAGNETIHIGSQSFLSTMSMASIISPDLNFHMRHGDHTEKLFIQIPRHLMEDICRIHYGRELNTPLIFSPTIPLQSKQNRSLASLLHWQLLEAAKGTLFNHPLLAAQLETTLVTTLLETLSHNHQRAAPIHPLTPHFVRQAEEYIHEHIDQPIAVTDISQAVGISSRCLFAGFKKYRDTSPMRYLMETRLVRVRKALQTPSASTTVTDTALRWGFGHLGQFSAAYKNYFHELPSATLLRHRRPI